MKIEKKRGRKVGYIKQDWMRASKKEQLNQNYPGTVIYKIFFKVTI